MKWTDNPFGPHEPMHMQHYERREYRVRYTDGTEAVEVYNAWVVDTDGSHHRREVDHFEADGVTYAPQRTCSLTLTYAGWPCSDFECSACGKLHTAPTELFRMEGRWHCPRCGALCVEVRKGERATGGAETGDTGTNA